MDTNLIFGAEILLILVIIFYQSKIYFRNQKEINELEEIFPAIDKLKVLNLFISNNEAKTINRAYIHEAIMDSDLDTGIVQIKGEATDQNPIAVIHPGPNSTDSFWDIISLTNIYLVRNKNHAADFPTLKDIADREVDSFREQIESTLQMPLYLGLLGTILGIIFGLGELLREFQINPEAEVESINSLLLGVVIAMTASFVGLLLTVMASNRHYKRAIKKVNRDKTLYFDFIRTELLYILSKDMNTSLTDLQSNINQFNKGFSQSMQDFTRAIGSVKENIVLQKDFIEKLEDIGYDELAKANVKTFQELQKSGGLFKDFIAYQGNMNQLVQHFSSAIKMLDSMFSRFKNFEEKTDIAVEKISTAYTDYSKILNFFQENLMQISVREEIYIKHIEELDTKLQVHIAELDNTFQKTTEDLNQRARNAFLQFQSVTEEELNEIQKAYSHAKPQFHKLDHLETIDEKLGSFEELIEKISYRQPTNGLTEKGDHSHEIKQLNHQLSELIQISQKNLEVSSRPKGLSAFVKHLLNRKKKKSFLDQVYESHTLKIKEDSK